MLLTFLAAAVAIPAILLSAGLALECFLGFRRPRPDPEAEAGRQPTLAILVPAHDEEKGIRRTLASLNAADLSDTRIVVVADNCTDQTAAIARECGATVIERKEPLRRGKGFALAFAQDFLRNDPPDVVVVLDADCETDGASLRRLAGAAVTYGVPTQSTNLLRTDGHPPPMLQVSNFAFYIKNVVRQRALTRLGAPNLLTGTGMALPWFLFGSAALATDNLVEDLALGIELTERGYPPRFVEGAQVWSPSSSVSATLGQRARWEGGFLTMSRELAMPLTLRGIRQLKWRTFWMGFHLLIPPLALLVLLCLAAAAVAAVCLVLGASSIPLIGILSALTAAGLGLLLGWLAGGKSFLSASAAARLPLYVLWKLPMYFKLVKQPAQPWRRAERQ